MNQESKQKIDMTHGFMKSVIRNQIDRDNYDKEVKAKQQLTGKHRSSKGSGSKTKKPEIQTYTPPQRARKDPQDILFTLEYEHKNGEVFTVEISKSDSPREMAKRIGAKFDLPGDFVDVLTQRLHTEVDKRTSI